MLVAALGLGARGAFAGQQLLAFGDIGGDGDARAVTVFGDDAPLDIGDAAVGPRDRHGAFPAAAVRERDVQLSCTRSSCPGAMMSMQPLPMMSLRSRPAMRQNSGFTSW